jgi:hypothetical protein
MVDSRSSPAIGIIIESGSLISAAMLALLVVYLENSNGQYPALDLVSAELIDAIIQSR